MTGRSEIRPFAFLFENRRLLYKAGAEALAEAIDWPKIVISPLFTNLGLDERKSSRDSDCFAPADFADDMASNGVFALPYDKFVVVMGPCVTTDDDSGHWVATVERREDQLVGRSWMVGRDQLRNGAGIWSYRIGSDRNAWIDGTEGLLVDEEATRGPGAIILSDDPEKTVLDLRIERFLWLTTIFQCVGLLSSKGVASEVVAAPTYLNKKREQKKLAPIFSYRLLTINPQDVVEAQGVARGTHASPRLHWRRGHIRKLGEDRHTIVRPCLVGSIERGYVAKDYKVLAH